MLLLLPAIWLGILNDNQKFDYQIFLSFSFSQTQQSIIIIKILM